MSAAQERAWRALFELCARLGPSWCLVGGQMVHLYCAERGFTPNRPTEDADTVLDVRARPDILDGFTRALIEMGWTSAGESLEGHQAPLDQRPISDRRPHPDERRAHGRGSMWCDRGHNPGNPRRAASARSG